VLAKLLPASSSPEVLSLPYTVRTFQGARKNNAEQLADQLRAAGGQADVVRERHWTGFYFQQTLGPHMGECLRNSLLLAALSTLCTTLLCLPLAYWFTRYRFPGRGLLSTLLLVPLIVPPFVGAIGLERFLNRYGSLNMWLFQLGILKDPGSP